MIKGRMILITSPIEYYVSNEFSGNMAPSAYGQYAIYFLKHQAYDVKSFQKTIKSFNNGLFHYPQDNCFAIPYNARKIPLNFSKDYFMNFESDYLYVKNATLKPVHLIDSIGKEMVILPHQIACFYFGEYFVVDKNYELLEGL